MNPTLAPVRLADYRLGFTSLERELSLDDLPVEGALPAWLTGSLFRNGPARFEVGSDTYRHWFDGLGMLHRFGIADGKVSYANRFLRSPAFIEAERTGRITRAAFGTDPKGSLLERIGALFRDQSSDNANVNIVPFRDGYLALTETPSPVAFDGATLETRGVLTYEDDLKGQITTAHTHHDAERKATFNILSELGRTSRYHVVRIEDGTLRRTIVASISVDEPAYLHAFSTTERYVVVAEYPLVVRPLDLMFRRKPFVDNYRWQPQRGTRFHVIHKDGGAIAGTYEADAFFAFHHINAFEEGDAIVLDVAAYDDATVIDNFNMKTLLDDGEPALARAAFRRYRLVPGRSAAEMEYVAREGTELPRIAPARAGKTYRYAFGIDVAPDSPHIFNRLVKVDVRERNATTWSAPNAYPGEPVFVPRPGASDEDDGAVLCVVLDADSATSYLLVLDARTFAENARVPLPHHIPFGFHGIFRETAASRLT